MINLHESMGPGRDRTRDPWICSQLRICNQTRYWLRYAARWSAHEGTIYAYTKARLGENCLSSHSCHFVEYQFFLNQTPSCICSMCLHCISKVSNCWIKSCGRSWSAHEGTIYAYTKAILLGENCQSSHSCHFVKKIFFYQTPSCICSMCLQCIGKV